MKLYQCMDCNNISTRNKHARCSRCNSNAVTEKIYVGDYILSLQKELGIAQSYLHRAKETAEMFHHSIVVVERLKLAERLLQGIQVLIKEENPIAEEKKEEQV